MFKLLSQRGSLAFLLAGFMNAFVDLGHKIIRFFAEAWGKVS